MLVKSHTERRKSSFVRDYTLYKRGVLDFVGTVTEISTRLNIEPTTVRKAIRDNTDICGYKILIATKSDKDLYRFMLANKKKQKERIPQKYKDSHSVRFTPL